MRPPPANIVSCLSQILKMLYIASNVVASDLTCIILLSPVTGYYYSALYAETQAHTIFTLRQNPCGTHLGTAKKVLSPDDISIVDAL